MIELTDLLFEEDTVATTHEPVLLEEVLDGLAPRAGGTYIDGTAGSGGHARAIAERIGSGGRMVLFDRDAEALARSRAALAGVAPRCHFVHANFAAMRDVALDLGLSVVDGILLDLGLSSEQLDTADRGFSFRADAPLDMRMDHRQEWNASDVIRECSPRDMAELFRTLGEEPAAERVARAIADARRREPIVTTGQLAELVARVKGGVRGRIHPATRVFQALRMTVNEELASLERGIESAARLLAPGGRLAVIAFHSLEDRIVKQFMRDHEPREESLPEGGSRTVGVEPPLRVLTRKPRVAGEDETERNPRARSAKLRVAERLH